MTDPQITTTPRATPTSPSDAHGNHPTVNGANIVEQPDHRHVAMPPRPARHDRRTDPDRCAPTSARPATQLDGIDAVDAGISTHRRRPITEAVPEARQPPRTCDRAGATPSLEIHRDAASPTRESSVAIRRPIRPGRRRALVLERTVADQRRRGPAIGDDRPRRDRRPVSPLDQAAPHRAPRRAARAGRHDRRAATSYAPTPLLGVPVETDTLRLIRDAADLLTIAARRLDPDQETTR